MSEPTYSPPPPPVAPPAAGSNRALISLILGILGVLCCGILAPIAWYLGSQELKAIKSGLATPANQGLATAGMILGIIGTILLGLAVLWMIFFGGLGMLSALGSLGG